MSHPNRALTIIACAAGPAARLDALITQAHKRGWTVQVIATPSALDFLDIPAIEQQTARPIRNQYRTPGEPRSQPADAIIVAPATYNTINKWANGISDTYALGILAESTALPAPIAVLPFVNSALAARTPFRRSLETLRAEGVRILLGPSTIQPHEPHTGDGLLATFPWYLALDEAERPVTPN